MKLCLCISRAAEYHQILFQPNLCLVKYLLETQLSCLITELLVRSGGMKKPHSPSFEQVHDLGQLAPFPKTSSKKKKTFFVSPKEGALTSRWIIVDVPQE